MHFAEARSVAALLTCLPDRNDDFLLFWGHSQKAPGSIDKSCLSNWYPAPFSVDAETFATTEHFMMAEKARLFGDELGRAQILAAKSPGAAKKLGRLVKDFNDEEWKRHRFDIVVRGNLAKFSASPELSQYLARTGQRVLVEASPYDRIWGIGLGVEHPDAFDPSRWRGLNLLGFALMEVRHRLREAAT